MDPLSWEESTFFMLPDCNLRFLFVSFFDQVAFTEPIQVVVEISGSS